MQMQDKKPLLTPQIPLGEEAKVAEIFSAVEQRVGFVPDGLRLYSFSPPLLQNFVSNIGYFNSGDRVPQKLMAMIRYLGSSRANCQFCIDLNEGFLTQMGLGLDEIRAARNNPELAPLDEKEKSLLRLALKALDDADSLSAPDVDAARVQGWSDRDIFDAVAQATSNRAFNMMLRAFNVERHGVYS